MLRGCYDSVKKYTNKDNPVKCLMFDNLSDSDFPSLVSSEESLPKASSVESNIDHCMSQSLAKAFGCNSMGGEGVLPYTVFKLYGYVCHLRVRFFSPFGLKK